MLVFSYNKGSQNSNNSFYIVRVPCPVMGRCLVLYLACIRPFSDLLGRQLKLIKVNVPTNPHLFTAYDSPLACFGSAAYSKILQQSTSECPILISWGLHTAFPTIPHAHAPHSIQASICVELKVKVCQVNKPQLVSNTKTA
jgi:hypothetical protein